MSDKKDSELLKEYKLSWAGKLFFAGVAAKIVGHALKRQAAKMRSGMNEQEESSEKDPQDIATTFPFKLKGTPEQIQAVMDVVQASIDYQQELTREGATVESVMEKLNSQNLAKKAFEERTGHPWPL